MKEQPAMKTVGPLASRSATVTPLPVSPPSRPVALEARGIWKVFGPQPAAFRALAPEERAPEALARRGWVGAVQDASFAIARGEVFVIMGLSGSGKSTLLRCLTRLVEPSAGEVLLNGEDLCRVDDARLRDLRRRHMGMVFQHFALLPNRTVLGNIAFPLQVQGVPRAEAEARARALIDTVGLAGRDGRYPTELSGGQQQRVGIARSLATDPDVWFLDEPFSALDPLIRADLQDEVLRLQGQMARTVIFVTHDLDEAIRLADRIAIMEGGRIVQIGTPEALVTQPATDYVRRFVAKVPPARVVRVASLMEAGPADGLAADPVPSGASIAQIAPRLIAGPSVLPVVDASGARAGRLDRMRALAVLAGGV
jgi:glycine betaine/proline transport system ATP-binding protein